MNVRCDLHLHSCLSPCGDADMTPRNIANMAALLELELIALTDHNSCGNCRAAEFACKEAGVAFVPGMELCTAEELHLVCLFPDCDSAEAFWAQVKSALPPVKNKAEVFGEQLYMDGNDIVTGSEPILLVTASGIGVGEAPELVERFGGVCWPAHVDRPSFSILSSLGGFPPEPVFRCAELTPAADYERLARLHPALRGMRIIRASDAHRLEDMRGDLPALELPELSAQAVIKTLRAII